MTNPFDHNFFKFLIGFVCILLASFTVLYLVGMYGAGQSQDTQASLPR